jgi:hypothetical protein
MRCHRCGGVMICEKFYGDLEYFFGWKCISCGEIVDEVILENRQHLQMWHGSISQNRYIWGPFMRRKQRWETGWPKADHSAKHE